MPTSIDTPAAVIADFLFVPHTAYTHCRFFGTQEEAERLCVVMESQMSCLGAGTVGFVSGVQHGRDAVFFSSTNFENHDIIKDIDHKEYEGSRWWSIEIYGVDLFGNSRYRGLRLNEAEASRYAEMKSNEYDADGALYYAVRSDTMSHRGVFPVEFRGVKNTRSWITKNPLQMSDEDLWDSVFSAPAN